MCKGISLVLLSLGKVGLFVIIGTGIAVDLWKRIQRGW